MRPVPIPRTVLRDIIGEAAGTANFRWGRSLAATASLEELADRARQVARSGRQAQGVLCPAHAEGLTDEDGTLTPWGLAFAYDFDDRTRPLVRAAKAGRVPGDEPYDHRLLEVVDE